MPLPRYHAAVSLGVAGIVVARTRRWQDAVPVLVAGVLVDLDHLFDLVLLRRFGRTDVVVLPLHAWELVLALLFRGGTRTTRGMAGGLAAHLALDQHNWTVRHPLFYWITVRAWYRFRACEPLVHRDRFHAAGAWTRQHPLRWV